MAPPPQTSKRGVVCVCVSSRLSFPSGQHLLYERGLEHAQQRHPRRHRWGPKVPSAGGAVHFGSARVPWVGTLMSPLGFVSVDAFLSALVVFDETLSRAYSQSPPPDGSVSPVWCLSQRCCTNNPSTRCVATTCRRGPPPSWSQPPSRFPGAPSPTRIICPSSVMRHAATSASSVPQ